MIFPVDLPHRIVSSFSEPRPLSLPPAERKNIHGAWDIAVPEGTRILAPVDGNMVVANIFRSRKDVAKPDLYWPGGEWFAHSRFYNDTYGAILIVYGDDGRTFLFAHTNQETWWHKVGVDRKVIKDDYDRWVMMYSNILDPLPVGEGDVIGYSGNEGSSFGPHIHMSIHKGLLWDRVDPATLWPGEVV